jgi:hypothetical protein
MRQPQLIAWAWGINGALSVLGATLAVFIAMNWGFSITLLSGAVLYGAAAVNLTRSEATEMDLHVSRSQMAAADSRN